MQTTITPERDTAFVLLVANTRHGPGGHYNHRAKPGDPPHDHLADRSQARAFLASHGVAVPEGDPDRATLARLRAIRGVVASLLARDPVAARSGAGLLADRARYRLDAAGRLSAVGEGWQAFTDQPLPALIGLLDAGGRLKLCANEVCGWVYLDASRNRSRIWCDSTRCGNQQRVRRSRQRARRSAAPA